MQIGERLKAIRESKQMSQGHVEKATGLLRCYVSRVENGHTVPSIETLEKWSRALGISLSQLFAEDGKPEKPLLSFNDRVKLNRAAANSLRRIRTALSRMSPRDIVLVTSFASKLAARQS